MARDVHYAALIISVLTAAMATFVVLLSLLAAGAAPATELAAGAAQAAAHAINPDLGGEAREQWRPSELRR